MPRKNLADEIKRFGTWMYKFQLTDGISTPMHVDWLEQIHETRYKMIFSKLVKYSAIHGKTLDVWILLAMKDTLASKY